MRPRTGAGGRGLPKTKDGTPSLPKIEDCLRWQDKFCKTCGFCIGGDCRESPPSIRYAKYGGDNCTKTYYPIVKGHKACSKYQPKKKRKQQDGKKEDQENN